MKLNQNPGGTIIFQPRLIDLPGFTVPDICLATAARVIAPRSPKRLVKRSPAAISSGPSEPSGGEEWPDFLMELRCYPPGN